MEVLLLSFSTTAFTLLLPDRKLFTRIERPMSTVHNCVVGRQEVSAISRYSESVLGGTVIYVYNKA